MYAILPCTVRSEPKTAGAPTERVCVCKDPRRARCSSGESPTATASSLFLARHHHSKHVPRCCDVALAHGHLLGHAAAASIVCAASSALPALPAPASCGAKSLPAQAPTLRAASASSRNSATASASMRRPSRCFRSVFDILFRFAMILLSRFGFRLENGASQAADPGGAALVILRPYADALGFLC